jgi:6-phospho-beta-glucosidase
MNEALAHRLLKLHGNNDDAGALQAYIDYLNLRSGSYMKLEGEGVSAFDGEFPQEDPFRAASGYHRIALQVMNALCSTEEHQVIVNTTNGHTVPEIDAADIIETTCNISKDSIAPIPIGPLPDAVRGLVLAVKAYERTAIDAALTGSNRDIRKAMLLYPAISEWEPSEVLLNRLQWKP